MATNNKDLTPPANDTNNNCIDGNDKEANRLASNGDASSAVNGEDVTSPVNKTESGPPAVDGDTGVAANKEDTAKMAVNQVAATVAVDKDTAKAASSKEAAPPAAEGDIAKAANAPPAADGDTAKAANAPPAADGDTAKGANAPPAFDEDTANAPRADDEDTAKAANNNEAAPPAVDDEDNAKVVNKKEAVPPIVDGGSGKPNALVESHGENSEDTGKEDKNKDSGKPKADGERQSDNSDAESEDAEKKTEDEEGTPTLDKLGINLTKLAQEGKLKPSDGREELVDRVIQILCRQSKCSPCLVGNPGNWKTAAIESLAQRIESGTVPQKLKEKKIISIASNHPEATGYAPGMLGANIIKEAKRCGEVIVLLDEDLTLSNSSVLKPALERGDILCIGATKTIGEYTTCSSIESVFQAVKAPEPSMDDTVEILKGRCRSYETYHKVCYTDKAFVAAVKLSSRYMSDGILLEKAMDLLDEAGSRAQLLQAKAIKTKNVDQDSKLNEQSSTIKNETNTDENKEDMPIKVTKGDVRYVASSRIEIPVHEVSKEESECLLKLEDILHKSIIGQQKALIPISDAMRRAGVGPKSSKRPISIYSDAESSDSESEDAEKKTENEEGTPTLDKLGINLTKLAKEGKLKPSDGREELVDRVIQILCRQSKCSPCLVGNPGSWKTAIIESLAQRIVSGTVPQKLKEKKIISIASNHPEATGHARGMLGANIIKEAKRCGEVIVFLDEGLTLSNSSVLKPALERGDLLCIGAAKTFGESPNRSSMGDLFPFPFVNSSSIENVFQAVKVPEPSMDDTIEILKGLCGSYETHHKVCYADEAFVAAVKLSSRYMSDGILLEKAIDLLDEAGSRAQLLQAKAIKTKNVDQDSKLNEQSSTIKTETDTDENKEDMPIKVTKEDVQSVVSSRIEIPVHEVSKEESERLLKLEDTLHESIIGQHEALIAISDAIRRARVGLKSSKRPIASFIFTGPTGVGKTEVAKTLARQYFGSEDSMVRFDMSEYMEKHQVSKLIGSPPGYVMCREGGQLTEAVRRKPYTVILFDEIEKAHPDILNLMLQILDDGRLTDNKGEIVTFSNTIIIMTSNVGGNVMYSGESSGVPDDKIYDLVMTEIRKSFRAEFLNRFDEIILFKQLTKGEVSQIADLMFKEVGERLKAKNIKLNVSGKFSEKVVKDGYSLNYGARQLRRVITTLLENLLARKMLAKDIKDGDSVLVDVDSEGNIEVLKSQVPCRENEGGSASVVG